MKLGIISVVAWACLLFAEGNAAQGEPWRRHVIDASGRGADGVKLADVNGDGRSDIVTGWEEGGLTRLYVHPGRDRVCEPWPAVTVGRTPSVEDAVLTDLDGDGNLDVVVSTEGDSRRVFVHWSPGRDALLTPTAWKQDVFPALTGLTGWMFAEPLQIDGRHGVDLVIGGRVGKDTPRAMIGWLEAPARARELADWRWHPLLEMRWTMSIVPEDMDGDGDRDILYSDRSGDGRGVHWLENPGPAAAAAGGKWTRHTVGGTSATEIMLLDSGDVDGDGLRDIAVCVGLAKTEMEAPARHGRVAWFRRLDAGGRRWSETLLPIPAHAGSVKSVAIGDMDGDGRRDFVVSSENATGERIGVYWLKQPTDRGARSWETFDISGAAGIKFDLVRLLDLDGDGDLDVLTCEERENRGGLGVIWYENPAR